MGKNEAFNLTGDARLSLGMATVTISHIAFMVPFVTLVVQARLTGFDKSYEEAAMDLGRERSTTFRRVTFPNDFAGYHVWRFAGFYPVIGRLRDHLLHEWTGLHYPSDLCLWFASPHYHTAGERAFHGLDPCGVLCCFAAADPAEP